MKGFSKENGVKTKDQQLMEFLLEKFQKYEGRISLKAFRSVVQCNNESFAVRVFHQFSPDENGDISLMAYVNKVSEVLIKPPKQKLQFLFQIYDVDGNGSIELKELREVLISLAEENNLDIQIGVINDLCSMLMAELDSDKSGDIDYEEFITFLSKYPDLIKSLSESLDNWLLPRTKDSQKKESFKNVKEKAQLSYIGNNIISFVFLALFLLVNLVLIGVAIRQYIKSSGFVIVARVCGLCLNFTSAFALILMARRCITWLRCKGLNAYLPLDDYIYFHKLTGCFIFGYSVIHTIMHIFNFRRMSMEKITIEDKWGNSTVIQPFSLGEYLFTAKAGIGWVGGSATITGWMLLALLTCMVIAAHPSIRRSKMFEIFFFSHLLFIPYYIILLLHGPNFWKWFLVPAIIYAFETIRRIWDSVAATGKTCISQAVLLPGKVIHLMIKRPKDFRFNAGDYVFLNIPSIAKYEWHPFTISSSPESEKFISFHIHAVGHWTNRLHEVFSKYSKTKKSVIRSKSLFHESNIDSGLNPDSSSMADYNLQKTIPNIKKIMTFSLRKREDRFTKTGTDNKGFMREHKVAIPEEEMEEQKQQLKEFSKNFLRTKHQTVLLPDENGTIWSDGDNNSAHKHEIDNIMPAFVAGPYGSPSSEMFSAEHAILIGTGIGVTPFASILQRIMSQYIAAKVTCPNCQNKWIDQIPAAIMKLRKVEFYWINRSHKSIEWFMELLRNLEKEEKNLPKSTPGTFLSLNLYVTSAMKKDNVRSSFLQMALDLKHRASNEDVLTGLQTKAIPGRPDWNKIFKEIRGRKQGKVSIFFCGSPQLGKLLRAKCNEFGFRFHKEKF